MKIYVIRFIVKKLDKNISILITSIKKQNNMSSNSVANNIINLLKSKDISIHAFEKQYKLPANSVSNIVNGRSKKPSAELLKLIADAFECTVDELFNEVTSINQSISKLEDSFKDIPINTDLLLMCVESLVLAIDTHKKSITVTGMLQLLEETYSFAAGSPNDCSKETIDRFADWRIERRNLKSLS
jgi:transcriptional regulator with XRE-family HTH domain